jgi:hypothetical protein
MYTEANVTRMRRLLSEATQPSFNGSEVRTLVRESERFWPSALVGAMRRRAIIKQIALATSCYGLREDVDAFLAAAGVASLAGLDDARLDTLASWLAGAMDRISTCCDSPHVTAR